MMAHFLLLAAIGLVFVAPLCVWLVADAKARHDAEQAYAAGYRQAQRDDLQREGERLVARQSRQMQAEAT